MGNIPEVEFENLAKKCLRIANDLWIKRKFDGDSSISNRMKNYQKISKSKIEQYINKECDLSDFESRMLFDEFYSRYTVSDSNSDSKINVSREIRKIGYIIKKENYQDKSGNWTAGTRIYGIKWRETQEIL